MLLPHLSQGKEDQGHGESLYCTLVRFRSRLYFLMLHGWNILNRLSPVAAGKTAQALAAFILSAQGSTKQSYLECICATSNSDSSRECTKASAQTIE